MQKITRNDFIGGVNTDVDEQRLEPNFYTEAYNLELVGDGKFFALRNIKGTTSVQDVINVANTEVLGVFENKYKIDTAEDVKCLTIFTVNASTFNIYAYDTQNDVLYSLYQENTAGDYITNDRVIDARAYAENGIDILYFTDNYNEIRQLRCEIPAGYSANFLTATDLSLQRYGANGTIELDTVTTGGSLLSGTYQFAYRMVDTDRKRFTKWSSLTNPVHVYNDDTNIPASGYGLYTDKLIRLDITPSGTELGNFEYFQVAVVENIFPTDVTVRASLLPIQAVADYISAGVINDFEYNSNNKIDTIPIEDIVIDFSPVKTAKTLAVQQNRLFAGNITYHNLEYDNGTPEVSDATVNVVAQVPTDVNQEERGYFRDEVYRFAVVYFDKYGNKSAPSVLDFSGATGNIGSSIDFRFPDRSTSNSYTILDSSDIPRQLGLTLTGLQNHPSWAIGFEIVRAKRIKKVLFQSPVIPYTSIKGIGALAKYPTEATDGTNTTSFPNAQPMTSDEIYIPNCLFWPEMRRIDRLSTAGEAYWIQAIDKYSILSVFPPESQYKGEPFKFSGSEAIQDIDLVNLKLDVEAFSGGVYGTQVSDNISGTFHALTDGQYYFDSAWSAKSLSSKSAQIAYDPQPVTASVFLDNFSTGEVLSGVDIQRHSEMKTDGIEIGVTPTVCRQTVLVSSTQRGDLNRLQQVFADGTHNAFSLSSTYIFGSSGPQYQGVTSAPGAAFVNSFSNFSESLPVHVLSIANIINPSLGDDRYGDTDANLEFISTGAKYLFAAGEVSGNTPITIPVWGGDCIISNHIFKVSDSTYTVVNNQKHYTTSLTPAEVAEYWGHAFLKGSDPISMPLSVKAAAQYVQVYLESEYNGEAADKDILIAGAAEGSTYIRYGANSSTTNSPLNYNYNLNLAKENDQKVYFPKPEYSFERYNYEARIQYSDIKIYNSPEQGFDIFRVGNFRDLEESGGGITKLAVAMDNAYAIQENRTIYLPIGERLLETSDAGTLAVGSAEVIGTPKTIDRTRGSQHLGAIVETGRTVLIPDNKNKAVYSLEGQNLPIISDKFNASYFRSVFGTIIAEKGLKAIHDPIRKEYWLFSSSFCRVYNYGLERWVGNYEPTNLLAGQFTNQTLYILGKVTNQVSVYSMYTGVRSQFFGTTVTPRVKIIVNPDSDFSKTFDDMMFVSSDRLSDVDLLVERESSLGNQTVNNIDLNLISREGNYRVKVLRDSVGARLRGLRMTATVNWLTTDVPATLSAIFTKYRMSSKQPI